eukprot:gene36229-59288_t
MSSDTLIYIALGAVLVFWAVGAYNRLIGLRNDIAARFVPVDTQLQLRHGLLRQRGRALRADGHEQLAAQPRVAAGF